MHFNEHPTWRMLEEGKNYFKFLAQSSNDVEIVLVADSAIQSLHSLQLEVENQLITDSRDSDE
jgi:hypothetical protein